MSGKYRIEFDIKVIETSENVTGRIESDNSGTVNELLRKLLATTYVDEIRVYKNGKLFKSEQLFIGDLD